MQRFTISLDDDIAEAFDELIQREGYQNRSEAFRDLLRRELLAKNPQSDSQECVAVVSYLFDHQKRHLTQKLLKHQHDHDSTVVSTLHVHATPTLCVESVVLRGHVHDVQEEAKGIIATTGVHHGSINLIPVDEL